MTRVVCLSDTHGLHRRMPEIPDGDVLIHAGDSLGLRRDLSDFNDWLGELPHRHKIVIAGNHDSLLQESPELAVPALSNAIYLQDSGVEIEGLRFWGSPWTPAFMDWWFMLDRGEPLRERWRLIPDDTDVLIVHGPPAGIGDEVINGLQQEPEHVGCADLLERIHQLSLKAGIFGHIHEGYGGYDINGVPMLNASTCTERYQPINPPFVLDL